MNYQDYDGAWTGVPEEGAGMTTPYSPDTAMAIMFGRNSGGYLTGQSPNWDDELGRWNETGMFAAQTAGLAAVLAGLTDAAAQQAIDNEAIAGTTPTPLRVVAIGDSITAGVGSSDGKGFRSVLANILRRHHLDTGGPVVSGAASGFTLGDIAPSIPSILTANDPDIVILALGTNDAARPELNSWQTRYGAAVDQILGSAPDRKVVCVKVMLSAAGYASGEQTVNSAVAAVVSARQTGGRVALADFSAISNTLTVDGVHGNDLAYHLMALTLYRAMQPWLPS